jgi:hypothetical protein
MPFYDVICILLVQAILWSGATDIALGLFTINYAKGWVKWFGVGQAVLGLLSILFIQATQLPGDDPIINIGIQHVGVLEYTLASLGMIIGILIGIFLFLLLLMRK